MSDQTRYDHPIPHMGDHKPFPTLIPHRTQYRVEFITEDSMFPQNWPVRRKAKTTAAIVCCTMIVAMSSSIWGPMIKEIERNFHVGTSVAALGTCLYVAGFASGPLLWGPLSEYLGRRIVLLAAILISVIFSFITATAKDFQTLMIGRLFSGAFGAAAVAIAPSIFAGMFNPSQCGTIISLYAFTLIGGPSVGPVISGFVVNSYLGWRWPIYIISIMLASSFVGIMIFLEETYPPKVLCDKAMELRERTGNWAIYAEHETVQLQVSEMLKKSITRPVKMLFTEPILFSLSVYGGLVNGLLYLCLTSFPTIYAGYGWRGGNTELPYFSMIIGCMAACSVEALYYSPQYKKLLEKTRKQCVPEARLSGMMVAGIIFAISIFWICWSGAYPQTTGNSRGCHWMLPVVGMALFGYGFVGLYLTMMNYIIDTYLGLSASAVAANVFIRSGFGAAFPLFSTQMFENLGIQWAGTLVGCLSTILIPIPFLFYKLGARIRAKSKFVVDIENNGKE